MFEAETSQIAALPAKVGWDRMIRIRYGTLESAVQACRASSAPYSFASCILMLADDPRLPQPLPHVSEAVAHKLKVFRDALDAEDSNPNIIYGNQPQYVIDRINGR
jgi:hypothetical protein